METSFVYFFKKVTKNVSNGSKGCQNMCQMMKKVTENVTNSSKSYWKMCQMMKKLPKMCQIMKKLPKMWQIAQKVTEKCAKRWKNVTQYVSNN